MAQARQGLNAAGEIENQAAFEKIDPLFLPLFDRVILEMQQAFGTDLHSLYAYGSIPEGRATRGKSDADFLIVLHQPDAEGETKLAAMARQMQADFAHLVSKIDLPMATRAEVLARENREGLGAYLKILGLPIWGDDLRKELPAFRPSLAMAKAWNGDLREDLEKVQAFLAGPGSEAEQWQKIRAISGKAVRALYMSIAPETQAWTTRFSEQAAQVSAYFPDHADMLDYLVSARAAGKPVGEFAEKLNAFTRLLLPEFEAKLEPNQRPDRP
ncbi:MAG: nucleotidyltransferase domain-containing protein [Candidatus Sericytochromatia bacterium]